MKSQNDARLFHMTYYVNYITGEIIGGRQYGFHEETVSHLKEKARKEHPAEYAAFQRYSEEIREQTGEWLDNDDFLVRLLGWSYVNLGDYKYMQAETYIQTASNKPYSLFWEYVRRTDSHLERHSALVYDAESDSIHEVSREEISQEELEMHAENLEYQGRADISDWYNDKPVTKLAKMEMLKKSREELYERERRDEEYREEQEKRELQERYRTVGRLYYLRVNHAIHLLGKSEEYVQRFGFVNRGYESIIPEHFKEIYEQALKDGFTRENVLQLTEKYFWDVDRRISDLMSKGEFEQGQPFGQVVNEILAEFGLPFQIDPNAYYKNVDGNAVIYENGEPIDINGTYMNENYRDGTRLGYISANNYKGIFLEEWDLDKTKVLRKSFDIKISDLSSAAASYKVFEGEELRADYNWDKDSVTLDEWLKTPEVAAFLEEVETCYHETMEISTYCDFNRMDSYIKKFNSLKYMEEQARKAEPQPVWEPYWTDLLSEGVNIYLFNDGAETRGYAKFLEDALGVNVIIGDYRDKSTLLRGGHNDFDLLIFDRTDRHAIYIANELAEVCDKEKMIVPVDSFSYNVLSHYLHKGDEEQQGHAKESFAMLAKVTNLEYGEINNFPIELAKYIAGRLRLEMRITEQQTQKIELPDKYKLRESLRYIERELYDCFEDGEEDDFYVAMEISEMIQQASFSSFKDLAEGLKEAVERLKGLSVDNRTYFRIWHEVAQVREAALRGAKIELALTENKLGISLNDMDMETFKLLLTPTVAIGEHDELLDKGKALANGAASGTIKTNLANLENGDIFVCENLFEAQDVIPIVGGVIAHQGNFSDHAAVLASMRNIPVVLSATEFLFEGENVTIDGETGKLYKGRLPIVGGISKEQLSLLMSELPSESAIRVCANADTAYEVDMAISNFAEGVGLVRVENMVSRTEEDFYRIAVAAKGKDVTFRITKPFDNNQIEAAVAGSERAGLVPKILIPQVESTSEIDYVRSIAGNVQVGSMIESVETAKNALAITQRSDFIAFGTNDLTADFYGVKRDSDEVSGNEHFISISNEVAEIMKLAVDDIRKVKANIEVGVCGRQADDDKSIIQFTEMGIDYVSVSPAQVPVIKFAVSKKEKTRQKKKIEDYDE